ncbi:MAG: flavohemoglobin expression-modulating QEGLA motif protein [Gammaproteobacteria bacterium]|nr:flavohemoglobin expression-modulating QEGLA motif protein [Gammaproteobacteria bacterium]
MPIKKTKKTPALTKQQVLVHELSKRIVVAQKPLRILDAIKWEPEIQQQFFADKAQKLPEITKEYYQRQPLDFDPEATKQEFRDIEQDIQCQLGHCAGIGEMMQDRCREYIKAIELIEARGTDDFGPLSLELYGSAKDTFYPKGPTVINLAEALDSTFARLKRFKPTEADEKKYSARQAAKILNKRLKQYFTGESHKVSVVISNQLIADAAAGADKLKLRGDIKFSDRELRMLEVHEGWIHLATTFNGLEQPICTFLSKGPPSSTVTQEGLAVIMEIVAFASYPSRIKKISDRITAINMAENGADFLEIYRYFLQYDYEPEESYQLTSRIFRGSLPNGKPFTKDLAYGKGFISVFNYLRLAVQKNMLHNIPSLFVGKTRIADLPLIAELMQEGFITAPPYIPPQFRDTAALSSWLSFTLFMSEIDLNQFSNNYRKAARNPKESG